MKLKMSNARAFFAFLSLVMVFTVTLSAFPTTASATDTSLIFTENSLSGTFNPQYAIDSNGDKTLDANMTAFNQMAVGTRMFVVLSNVNTGKFLTSVVKNGQCTGKDITESAYNKDAESEKSGSLIRFVWLLFKLDENKFQFRPAYATAGRLSVNASDVTLEDFAFDTEGALEQEKWTWTIEQLSSTNGTHVAIKNVTTGGYLTLDKSADSLAGISAALSTDTSVQWNLYPVFQGVNPYTEYGFAQDGVRIDIKNRKTYELEVVRVLKTSITSFSGKGAMTYDGSGSAADALLISDLEKSTCGDATTQTFELTSYGTHRAIGKMGEVEDKEDPQFMLWEINPIDYTTDGPNTFDKLALDASGTLGFKEKNDSASQRFLIFYSMTEDGGYYLASLKNDGGLKVIKANEEGFKSEAVSSEVNKEQLLLINGCDAENINANDDLVLTVKDVVVNVAKDADGNDTYTIVEGMAPLKQYVFSNDMYAEKSDEWGVYFSEAGNVDEAGCTYNKLVVGTILSARVAEYSEHAEESYDGYKLVAYTYTNIVPDNSKNVVYRYFASESGEIIVPETSTEVSEETTSSAESSKEESSKAEGSEAVSSTDDNTSGGNTGLVIGIIVAVVVVVAAVVVVVLKKKKQ